jgi:uncharacterized membrane protein YeiB
MAGVIVMNWVAKFTSTARRNGDLGGPDVLVRLLDPFEGVLSTRFAAVFVLVAGIGISLMARGSRDLEETRWRLRRRGVLLLVVGFFFHWIWSGEILHFYGWYFVVASFVLGVSNRGLIALCGLVIAAHVVLRVALFKGAGGLSWLLIADLTTPKGTVADLLISGTHPLLPWLVFVFVGMWIGRHDLEDRSLHRRLIVIGGALLVSGYVVSAVATRTYSGEWQWLFGTRVFAYMPLYVVVTLGSSLAAVGLILSAVRIWSSLPITRILARAGQMTFSLYLLHGVLGYALIKLVWPGRNLSVPTALVVSLGFWLVALAAASAWRARLGLGPAELVYRRFGG